MQPIYTSENCRAAFQLNWSIAVFGQIDFPPIKTWNDTLKTATESDGVQILETRITAPNVVQFFVSTTPKLNLSDIVRSIKGRWQYILRDQQPKAFRRNYFIGSVGAANSQVLDAYVARQVQHHPMSDPRLNSRIAAQQFHDPNVELTAEQVSNYGKYLYALHVVIENAENLHDVRDDVLRGSREMVVRAAKAKDWRLSRIGLLSNHIHILLGLRMSDSPESVAISLLNNLAYVQDMKPVFRYSYYVGTIGSYDRDAIRQTLS